MYGRALSAGGQAMVALDNGTPTVVDFKSADGTAQNKTWMQDSLDKKVTHTLKVTYQAPASADPNSHWPIAIDSFVVDTDKCGTRSRSICTLTRSASPPNSSEDRQSQDSEEDDSSRTISLAAGLSGGFALLLALLACAFYWYRRRQQQQPRYKGVHPLNLTQYEQGHGSSGYPPAHDPYMRSSSGLAVNPYVTAHVLASTSQVSAPSYTPPRAQHVYTSSSSALLPNASHSRSPTPSAVQANANVYVHHQPVAPQLHVNIASSSSSLRQPRTAPPRLDTNVPATEVLAPPPTAPWNPSPTETTHSYESWTSSDFGPVPSPFVANGPPVPPVPPHLASSVEKGVRRPVRRTTRQSNMTSLPPYSANPR